MWCIETRVPPILVSVSVSVPIPVSGEVSGIGYWNPVVLIALSPSDWVHAQAINDCQASYVREDLGIISV